MSYEPQKMGERLKKMRKKHNYTQDELIEKLLAYEESGEPKYKAASINRKTLSKYENGGITSLRLTTLIALSECLNCSVGYLIDEYEPTKCREKDLRTLLKLENELESTTARLENEAVRADNAERKLAAIKKVLE